MLLRLVPQETNIKFMKARYFGFVLSLLAIIASIGLFAVNGLNYGIDFRGGISIEIGMEDGGDVPLADVRRIVGGLDLGDVQVQEFGGASEALIRIERQPGDARAQTNAMSSVRAALSEEIPAVSFRQENVVGPKVSGELKRDGTIAVAVAVFAVLVYIWFRFEWQFGLGAVVALVHDVLLTVGFFSVTQLDFNLSIIAALLTIVGYSLNDTVVVYDRVRENIRRYRKMPMEDLLNLSLNQTLGRTLMTSTTTLLALFALFFFGGPVIQGFTAAMIWGVVIGTYSSVLVAVPLLLQMNVKRESLLPVDDEKDPTVDKTRTGNPFEHI
ncbi:protein-export membrane protein SecF [Kordiimonas sediminis]|uniref:Protein-export membrane protein SecF n=1 Tax=Kordiimonas sediminis TaxID=1735581 RepID=A0A919AVR7_9PROT|nr:protein translocase subunit SecF [Kordiimonas sediminis]GHF26072.1 protein-export membrane protein SecF [Kordiimonas sediminis]